MASHIERRKFLATLGSAAAGWLRPARAQQRERMRRIGVLTPFAADDPEGHGRLTAFAQGLQQLGWTVGRNIRIDYRWGDGKPDTMRKYAAELVFQRTHFRKFGEIFFLVFNVDVASTAIAAHA
jgi:hypothetical protein